MPPEPVPGVHHVTALARSPGANRAFYTETLGLRLVKTTVNHDDPRTYHLYYGDNRGTPGTTLTFFPYPDGREGEAGTGVAEAVAFLIPTDSVGYWRDRIESRGVDVEQGERFGEAVLSFRDPDGLILELVATSDEPETEHWPDSPVPAEHAIKGFHGVTLTLEETAATADLLDAFGYADIGEEGNRTRYTADGDTGYAVDVRCTPSLPCGRVGVGSIHHIAHRVPDQETQEAWRRHLHGEGFNVTPVIDRWYFHSIYFREPGGVLFEIATEGPGFTRDEDLDHLGETLTLPAWLEDQRSQIENSLPPFGDV